MEYPDDNPTQAENELNYLAGVSLENYLAYKRGEISEEDYKVIESGVQSQKEVIVGLVQEKEVIRKLINKFKES